MLPAGSARSASRFRTNTSEHRKLVDAKILRNLDARLTKIEEQVRSIRDMAADGRDCVDVTAQIGAVRAALSKVTNMMVANHVEEWFGELSSETRDGHSPNVEELLKVFQQYYR